jgi:predicted MFS family arabinose efflux permease
LTFGGTMLDPLQVAWVRDVLGHGPEVYAWLTTTHAASGIAGSLLVGRRVRAPSPRALMGVSSVVAGIALLVRFDVPSLALAFALSAVSGATSVASAIGVETLVQQSVPDQYRGRVFGSLGATLSLLSLCGAMVGGAVGEALGAIPALNLAAGLVLASGIVALRAFRPQTA